MRPLTGPEVTVHRVGGRPDSLLNACPGPQQPDPNTAQPLHHTQTGPRRLEDSGGRFTATHLSCRTEAAYAASEARSLGTVTWLSETCRKPPDTWYRSSSPPLVMRQVALALQRHQRSSANRNPNPPPSDPQYGVVGYTHAGGIDQPLTVIRQHHPAGLTTLVPHANYRGVNRAGTRRDGSLRVCQGQGGCINVLWPAPIRGAYHQGDATRGDWVGSLIPGMQDASGLLYKRNRYYNPQTGQFTQPDPMGIAGGPEHLRLRAGDPVTYSDPFGLKMKCSTQEACDLWNDLGRRVNAGL
jgi:RHS repeat-associated protein